MTAKDDPTINCSHLMVELSVIAGRKIKFKVGGNHPFGRRGLGFLFESYNLCISEKCQFYEFWLYFETKYQCKSYLLLQVASILTRTNDSSKLISHRQEQIDLRIVYTKIVTKGSAIISTC